MWGGPPFLNDRNQLRREIRQRRQQLDAHERHHRALALCAHLADDPLFRRARRIAFYLANDGEPDLRPLIELAWSMDKACFLPVVGARHSRRLWFLPYTPATPLVPNRFGIPEPRHHRGERRLKPHSLDLILMPLVAFDAAGHRLGMGGGYYDTTLAFLRYRRHWLRPARIGTAFACQEVPQLPAEPWDVPLDAIATEAGIRHFTR